MQKLAVAKLNCGNKFRLENVDMILIPVDLKVVANKRKYLQTN